MKHIDLRKKLNILLRKEIPELLMIALDIVRQEGYEATSKFPQNCHEKILHQFCRHSPTSSINTYRSINKHSDVKKFVCPVCGHNDSRKAVVCPITDTKLIIQSCENGFIGLTYKVAIRYYYADGKKTSKPTSVEVIAYPVAAYLFDNDVGIAMAELHCNVIPEENGICAFEIWGYAKRPHRYSKKENAKVLDAELVKNFDVDWEEMREKIIKHTT